MKGCNIKYFVEYPSQSRLRDMFTYKDGELIGKPKTPHFKGRTIGTFDIKNPLKCKKVMIDKKRLYINRLVWIYLNGEIEDRNIIQFKDGDAHNCKIENLFSTPQEEKDTTIIYKERKINRAMKLNGKF